MAILDENYLTVEDVAELLRMSTSTVRRWINRGDLPAYRIGRRRVLVKRNDLVGLITPARPEKDAGVALGEQTHIAPLTDNEKRERLEALRRLRVLQDEMLTRRAGVLFPNAADEINELRDQRTRDLP